MKTIVYLSGISRGMFPGWTWLPWKKPVLFLLLRNIPVSPSKKRSSRNLLTV
ncbi:MAG: hypothetical protein GTO20_16435 [Candidatus Aminicenantes bacterium]|nr:hypothetical protein [Candidatus Aminicenantes bacterium]